MGVKVVVSYFRRNKVNKVKEGTIVNKATEVLLQNKVFTNKCWDIFKGTKHDKEIETFVVLILRSQCAFCLMDCMENPDLYAQIYP